MKKQAKRICCLLLIAVLSLAGCGPSDVSESTAARDSGLEQNTPEPSQQAVDWDNHQVTAAKEEEDGTQWYLRENYEDWITYPEDYDWKRSEYFQSSEGDVCARTQYVLYNDDGSFGKSWHCLDYFDMEDQKSYHAEVDLDEWGLPLTDLTLLDVVDDKLLACYFFTSEEIGTPRSFCSLLFYHMEDGILKTLDLLPALTAAGMADGIKPFSELHVLCDREGCCYIVLSDKILIVSDAGELLLLAQEDVPLTYLCKTPEGLPVFVGMDPQGRSNSYWVYDHAAGELRTLGESEYMKLDYGCMDAYGNLYHMSLTGKIMAWDTQTGAHENIFDCDANNICKNTASQKLMAVREGGDLVIMDPASEHQNIYVLSPNPPEAARTLTLDSVSYDNTVAQAAAAYFSRKNPGINIEFSAVSTREDGGAYLTNLTSRIVAGDGPDMFIIPADTMHILYEKGALADLSDAIPEELREQVFGSVWDAGTIDGKLIGLTTDIVCSSMIVSDDIWNQDTWTLEDMMMLAGNAPEGTLKGLIPRTPYASSSAQLLYWLALEDIGSAFVNRETGVCQFDCEQFRELLEICKNTPVPEAYYGYPDTNAVNAVMNGEYLAYPCTITDFFDFEQQTSLFPESYHWVGNPTDEGSGAMISASYFLVVNANTENMDLIREFLPTLYGDEVARLYPENCLRRDILRSRVIVPEWDPTPQFSMGEGVYRILTAKPDGTSYVEDYIAFMDKGTLLPPQDNAIASIVLEETEPYFSGNKDMDTVIGIIQSRVQLYLDENSF